MSEEFSPRYIKIGTQAVRDKLANREESRQMRESLAFLWQKWARRGQGPPEKESKVRE